MAIAPESQRRRLRGVELLQPAPPAPAAPLRACLDHLRQDWDRKDDHLAASLAGLARDRRRATGPPLPTFIAGTWGLDRGSRHPQWRQALLYTKPQLLSALRQAGHAVKDLRIQQHHGLTVQSDAQEASIWARHPSRADVHGMGSVPRLRPTSTQR